MFRSQLSLYSLEKETFNSSIKIEQDEVYIHCCIFENCSSSNGGAILYNLKEGNFSCVSSSFILCSATKGGACYISVKNSKILNCKFSLCEARISGYAFEMSNPNEEKIAFETKDTSVVDCKIDKLGISKNIMKFDICKSIMNNCNVSFNKCSRGMIYGSESSRGDSISYCVFEKNAGLSLISSTFSSEGINVKNSFIVNNKELSEIFTISKPSRIEDSYFSNNCEKFASVGIIRVDLIISNCAVDKLSQIKEFNSTNCHLRTDVKGGIRTIVSKEKECNENSFSLNQEKANNPFLMFILVALIVVIVAVIAKSAMSKTSEVHIEGPVKAPKKDKEDILVVESEDEEKEKNKSEKSDNEILAMEIDIDNL